MEERIKLNFDFCEARNLNGNGLERDEIEKWIKEGFLALKSVNKRRWELGFTNLPYDKEIIEFVNSLDISKKEWENVVVIGIGGSSLGTSALFNALKPMNHNLQPYEIRRAPRFFVLDNPDPEIYFSVLENIKKDKTLFIFISKSGETIETVSYFYLLFDSLKDLKQNIVVISTLDKGFLSKEAKSFGLSLLPFPENVPGRYSVLSIAGMLPLSLLKTDISLILKGAKEMADFLHEKIDSDNPSVISASLFIAFFEKEKRIQVIIPYASSLYQMALWYSQLWAESLGKRRGSSVWGQTPFPALGSIDQHSQLQLWVEGPKDKIIFFWEIERFRKDCNIPALGVPEFGFLEGKSLSKLLKTEKKATENSLSKNGVPSMTCKVPEINPYFMGQLIYFLELQTVLAGEILGLNPFDQPGVELGKKLTKIYME